MTANWASISGGQSTLAPTSTRTTGMPSMVGKIPASAGRSTPGITPCTILAVAMTAPVLPAETKHCAMPSRTRREATRMELSRLVRTALAALSSMMTTSLAWTISMGRSRWSACCSSSRRTTSWRPTRRTLTLSERVARTAPSTSIWGAWSPPIASSAMVSMSGRGYSSTTSTTSRPLYWPQWGHTRCGSLGSWQFGHSEIPWGLSASCARRVLVRFWECLRFGFGIVLPSRCRLLQFQFAERGPAIVRRWHMAIARGLVPVLAANGADTFAGFAAHPLHRQSEHYLFAKDVLQFQAAALIKPDLRFAGIDFDLFLARDLAGGPVKQIEAGGKREARAHQTAVALRLHFHGVIALNANLGGVFNQLGYAGDVKVRTLLQLFSREIDFARRESLVKTDLPQLQLFDTKEHECNRVVGPDRYDYSRKGGRQELRVQALRRSDGGAGGLRRE